MIELRLLGGILLRDAEGHDKRALVTQPRRLALLAYLGATGVGAHRRDRLLSMFWPDLDAPHARAALRQALHVLRAELGDNALVTRGNEEIRLNFDHVRCDVADFERAVDDGRLTDALELYRGDLLDAFFISGAPEFERWQEEERARVRETAAQAAIALVEQSEAARNLAAAAIWARRALRLTPHDESLVRRLVGLLDLVGDRAGALKTYDEFARRLADDFDAEPSPETQTLIASVRARAETRAGMSSTRHSRTRQRHTVGRQREHQELQAALDAAHGGAGSLLCVAGEPGIGKTTLVDSFLAELAPGGEQCWVARGRCTERLAGTEAYLPVLEALQSLMHDAKGEGVARVLRRVAPSWDALLGPARRPSADRIESPMESQARSKLELASFLEELTSLAPVVLFFDDVHWVDPSTVDLLAFIGSRLASLRLLIVVAYRPSEMLLDNKVFWSVKLDLQARGLSRELSLEFLSREEIAQYIDAEFPGHHFPDDLAEKLHARTEGSPLFVVDLLRYLRVNGAIVEGESGWSLSKSFAGIETGLPESIRGMIQRKLGQLDPNEHRILVAASVQGQQFDSAVVASVLAQERTQIEERLDTLERIHGFVRAAHNNESAAQCESGRYSFIHTLYQNVIYTALAPARRASLSASTANALLCFHKHNQSGIALPLAHLYEVAGDTQQAAECLRVATENALQVSAFSEAAVLSNRGLELLRRLPESPERRRAELTLQIEACVSMAESKGWAVAEVESGYERARSLCKIEGDRRQLFRVLAGLWRVHMTHARLRSAREIAEQLLAIAGGLGDRELQVEAHHALSYPLNHGGYHSTAHEHAVQGLALYDPALFYESSFLRAQDPGVECHNQAARALWVMGYPDQSMLAARAAIDLADALAKPACRAWAHVAAGIMCQLYRDPSLALEHWDQVISLSRQHGLTQFGAWAKTWRGWAIARLGRRAEGIAQLREGLAQLQRIETSLTRPQCNALLAELLIEDGDLAGAMQLIADARTVIESSGAGYYEAELYRLAGEAHTAAADVGRAEVCFQQAIDLSRQRSALSFELRAATSMARLLRAGDPTEAREVLGKVYARFTEGLMTPDLCDARTILETIG